jgi:hypothetical protein
MTLFIQTPKRVLAISDAYVMALSFLLSYAIVRIAKSAIEKQQQKQKNAGVNVINPRGGNLGLELFSDDTELAHTILACIADNERYLVKSPEIIKIIFRLVKAKIKNESLILTPNMMRFLALKLINNDQNLIVKIGNIIVSSDSRARLFARVCGSTILGLIGALFAMLPYAVLMMVIYFDTTKHCGYKCSNYFKELPKEGPVKIYAEKSSGNLAIGANDDARQLEIYIPSGTADKVTTTNDGQLETTKTYTKSRKKAKQVNFSDFKKTDPVLSSFKNLEEPTVPQNICPVNEIDDIIGIRVD